MKEKIPSQNFIARVAGVEKSSLKNNIRILLKMMLKNGYTMNEKVTKRMNRETLKARKYRRFP